MVDELVAQPTHNKRVCEDNDNGQQVIEENHKSVPCTSNQTFLDKDTGKHCAEDTTCAVLFQYIYSIMNKKSENIWKLGIIFLYLCQSIL